MCNPKTSGEFSRNPRDEDASRHWHADFTNSARTVAAERAAGTKKRRTVTAVDRCPRNSSGAVSSRFPSAYCRGNKASLCCYRAATRPAGGVVRRSCDAGLTNPASAEAAESPRRVRSYAERQGRFGDEVPSSVTLPCECRVSNPSPKRRATSSVAGTEPAQLKVSALETRNVREAQRGRLNPRHNRHTAARRVPARTRAGVLGLARSILGGGSQRHTQPPVRERAQQRRQRLHAATGEGEEERSAWGVMDESIGSEIPQGGGVSARLVASCSGGGGGGAVHSRWSEEVCVCVCVCARVLPPNRPHSNARWRSARCGSEKPRARFAPPVEDAGESEAAPVNGSNQEGSERSGTLKSRKDKKPPCLSGDEIREAARKEQVRGATSEQISGK